MADEQGTDKLQIRHLRALFAAMAVNEDLLRRSVELLDNVKFPIRYAPYRGWFDIVKEQWREQGALPELSVLKSTLTSWLEEQMADPDEIKEVSEIFGFTKGFSKLPPDVVYTQTNKSLTKFAEMLVREDLEIQIQHKSIDDVLSQAKSTLMRVRASDADRFENPLVNAGKVGMDTRFYIPTGHSLYDSFTGGTGPAVGNVVGHGAVSGGGKTTFISQLASMLSAAERAENHTDELKRVYIFAYENVTDPMTLCLSFAAQVPRSKVDDYIIEGKKKQFSRALGYTKEEQRRFHKQIRRAGLNNDPSLYPNAEWERLQVAQQQLSRNLQIVNFSRSCEVNENYSTDYIDGIYRYIEDHQHKIGNPGVKAVFIDYAGLAVRRHLNAIGKFSTDRERALIEDGPSQATRIGDDFMCFVHIAQQLSGAQSSMAEGTVPDGRAFKGCTTFPENCDSCMVSGVPMKSNGVAVWVNSKSRRGKPLQNQIARLNGNYAKWETVDKDYCLRENKVQPLSVKAKEAWHAHQQKLEHDTEKKMFDEYD